jgi:protein-S-isoprenylcysteine O-methyltransferase Ste14
VSGSRVRRRSSVGTVVIGLILIVVGGYYVLRNTLGLDLPQLDSEQVVPVIAVVLGLALLYRAWIETGRPAGRDA